MKIVIGEKQMPKILLSAASIVFVIMTVGTIYYISILSHKLEQSERLNSDIALKQKCSESAASFYKAGGWLDNSQGVTSFYRNHWNKKIGKCFIQISSAYMKDNILLIDVYDVLESKRYASYNGHQVCDPRIVDTKECMLDSGMIWLDGDDARKTNDYHVGFNGIGNGGVGDANTQSQFLDRIRTFMND
jgi:hypothetical protein